MAHAARKLSAIVTFIIFFTISAFADDRRYVELVLDAASPATTNEIVEVDLQLVLAVDASSSMKAPERELQRDGYVKAFRNPEFIGAIRLGRLKRIAVTYFEWSDKDAWNVVMPWTLIDSEWGALEFANVLAEKSVGDGKDGTSIAKALGFAGTLFDNSGFMSSRMVVDVSGDGVNQGGGLLAIRDVLINRGITINGLPILLAPDIPDEALADYYRYCVIGGMGSFMVAIRDRTEFVEATRQKLVAEISQLQWPDTESTHLPIVFVSSNPAKYPDCG